MYAIETEKLTWYYGHHKGIIDLSMSILDGEIFGFMGPVGAGKTTTVRLLLGLIKPSSGVAKIFGKELPPAGGKLYRRVGYLPAEVNCYPEITGRDFLEYAAGFYNINGFQWVEELVDRLRLDPDKKFQSYSYDNRKKLGIIQALMHRPLLLILDEPGSGLDPLVKQELFKILEEINQRGTTIFFSTHSLEEVEQICHREALVKQGSMIHIGSLDELPGRGMRIVTLKVAGAQPFNVALDRLGDAEEIPSRPGYYRIVSRLPVNELISSLTRIELEYLRITDPSLEELLIDLNDLAAGGGNPYHV